MLIFLFHMQLFIDCDVKIFNITSTSIIVLFTVFLSTLFIDADKSTVATNPFSHWLMIQLFCHQSLLSLAYDSTVLPPIPSLIGV